ncbi:MAG: redox-sensing transcriptional repressor Rex [Clostridiales bacterium]|jgi:redox-sensing transcriptional repressor|nr:redox-sensing transcriptional repressor Rex [Clostridiales bacterium]
MQNDGKRVSEAVIKRLPRYYRVFQELGKRGERRISSGRIAEYMGVTASQVRQDFCSFGGFGQQGYGYDVAKMTDEFARIIGLDKRYKMVIVGAGNIGRALANYNGFSSEGYLVTALFDEYPKGDFVGKIPLYTAEKLGEYLKENETDIAVIAAPKESAENILEKLVAAGIKAVWNFAPVELKSTEGVLIENISMSDSLYVLSYKLNNK